MARPEQLDLFAPAAAPADRSLGGATSSRPRPPGSLRLFVLGSGSGGNALVAEAEGRRVLLDAGFSAREIVRRLRLGGLDPRDLEAIVVTHEHGDHARGAEQLSKRFKLPVWASAHSWTARSLRRVERAHRFQPGDRFELAGFRLHSFPVPHDARQPVGLVLESAAGLRLGLVADLGRVTRQVLEALTDLDLLVLECNHDERMLETGPYPWPLKRRVASDLGHLSNSGAARLIGELVRGASPPRLSDIVLYHLSATNNCPVLARETCLRALGRHARSTRITMTCQETPTGWLEVGSQLPLRHEAPERTA